MNLSLSNKMRRLLDEVHANVKGEVLLDEPTASDLLRHAEYLEKTLRRWEEHARARGFYPGDGIGGVRGRE